MIENRLRRAWIRTRTRCRWLLYEAVEKLIPPPGSLECPICGHRQERKSFKVYESRDIFGGGPLARHECPACGVIFGSQKMLSLSAEQLSREYTDLYAIYEEGDTTDSEIRTFYCLNPRPGGIYLNFGSGRWSKAIPRIRESGFNLLGYEPTSVGADKLEDFHITNPEDLKHMKFDGIMSNNVLEHLRHPEVTLAFLASLLKDGDSAMAHNTPCYTYCYEFSRFHLFFFTGNSIHVIARKAGLTVRDTQYPDVKLFFPPGGSVNRNPL